MPVSTQNGDAPWTIKQVADACRIVPTAAPRKIKTFERQLEFVLRACRGLDPATRDCDLAEMVTAVMATGGQLAAADRRRLLQYVRRRIGQL